MCTRIAFFGDSITQGDLGDCYVDLLQQRLPQHQLLNYGKNGDTIKSLYTRVQRLHLPEKIDIAFVWIGANDIIVQISPVFAVSKIITMQPWMKSLEEAEQAYHNLLKFVTKKANKVFTVPPVLIGEDTTNEYNKQLHHLSMMMKQVSNNFESVTFIDLQKTFWKALEQTESSDYILTPLSDAVFDSIRCRSKEDVDHCSEERHLQFTLDGIHLNSAGANLAADTFYYYIQKIIDKNNKKITSS